MEDVPGAALGLLPCRRLFPQTVRRPAWLRETTSTFKLCGPFTPSPAATNSNNRITFFLPKRQTSSLIHIRRAPCGSKGEGWAGRRPPTCLDVFFHCFLRDSFFDSVLPFTPHNPESLHNFWGEAGGSFLRNTGLCGVMGRMCVILCTRTRVFRILRMSNLRLNAKSSVEGGTVDTCNVCGMMTFFLSDVLHIEMKF